jgi:hypothetical protein
MITSFSSKHLRPLFCTQHQQCITQSKRSINTCWINDSKMKNTALKSSQSPHTGDLRSIFIINIHLEFDGVLGNQSLHFLDGTL